MPSHFAIASTIDSPPAQATPQNSTTIISQLETRFFEHQYNNDTDTERLTRLEQFIFGSNQTGSVNDRIHHILSAIPDDTTAKIEAAPDQASTTSQSFDRDDSANDQPANNDNNAHNNQQADDTSSANAFDYSSYPRVTSLEQTLLSHTYTADPLPRRLDRLETKAFGVPSKSTDLGQRVDTLDDYAQRHDIYGEQKISSTTNSGLAIAPFKSHTRNNTGSNDKSTAYPTTDQVSSFNQPPQYLSQTGSFVGSVQERVAMMEAQVYGHTYPDRALDKRLKKLEKKLLPNQDDSQLGLFERTGKLWIALHPTDKSRVDNLLAKNQIGAHPSSAPRGADSNDGAGSNSTTGDIAPKHHGWLHKLASTVGSVALNSASDPYTGYSSYSGFGYPYPGSMYVPSGSYGYPNSRFIGGSFGPGAGPMGTPVGFW